MTKVARILISFGIIFLVLLISIVILLIFLPAQSSSTVLANPSSCNAKCMCAGCQYGIGPPLLSDVRIQDMLIAYKWPDQINLNSSDTISVKITTNDAIAASTLTAAATGNYRIAGATPEDVGTPGNIYTNSRVSNTSVANAYGPKYKVFAAVQLLATTFDVKTFDLAEQPLDQVWDSWLWNIKPTSLGSQFVGIALNLTWKPINGGQAIQHQVWQTQIPITVTQPFLDKGQLSVGALITGALASGGLITGIITLFVAAGLEQFGKKRDKDKGEVAQQKSEKENKTGINQKEDDHVGEAKAQEAKGPAQLQRRSQALFVDIRSVLQQRSQALSIGIYVLLIMLILFLIGGSVFIYYTKVFRPAQLSAQATVAVTNATATVRATVQAPLTATATSALQLWTTSTTGSTALTDTLSDNSGNNGWEKNANCVFTGGSYHATSTKQGYLYFCLARPTTFADFAYQVQISINSGDEGCLILRFSMRGNTYSYDAFCADGFGGYHFITKPASVTTYSVLATGSLLPFRIGIDKTNSLAVIAKGSQYTAYVNNLYCVTVTDNTTSRGAIGVGALDDSSATDVAYSNAKVWTLS